MKHGAPRIRPRVPAAEWRLSRAGRRGIRRSSLHIPDTGATWIAASTEPKARQTAATLARRLHVPTVTSDGLREQDNAGVGFLEQSQFQAEVAALLQDPVRRFGVESGTEARQRFQLELERLANEHRGNGIVVSHGRVITLLVSHYNPVSPVAFWEQLTFGSHVTVTVGDWQLVGRQYETPPGLSIRGLDGYRHTTHKPGGKK